MKKYIWKVSNLFTVNTDTKTDYVVTAVYDIIGEEVSEGETYTATLSDSQDFTITEGSTFVPYADLTNDIVINWIQDGLGEDLVANYESSVGGMIDSKINPPVSPTNEALPW